MVGFELSPDIITRYCLSMTKLHFVGFNGYKQCPTNESSKVIVNWTCINLENILDICCAHRFIVIRTEEYYKFCGVLVEDGHLCSASNPAKLNAFSSCEDYLVASHKTDIWKFVYQKNKWEKLILSFNKNDEKVWNETDNEIIKFSFLINDDLLLLLSNGSVWKLKENQLEIIFSYDVEKAVDISPGFEHCLILTESGCVLSFGNGSRGQLGHGDLNPSQEPTQISALEGLKIIKIHAGGWHSCAITDSGDLCTWGWNNFGQLAAFEDSKEIGLSAVPVFVDVASDPEIKVADVVCGSRHTIIKLENGDLYSTGWNKYNQLGISSSLEKVSQFTKYDFKASSNVKLHCGPWYTILLE